ncbi:MAG: hypothetical protein GWN00_10080, partial [Aliifodinibius sp.]|nr:hypothetical protein [Fodinibius sp.]NIW44559.1 hypothetical protein [Gammaproteobacteria bacterium]NIX02627.1 hypothetical protein [Phycisphaerae bacterium]NIY25137.1 hypothetical protein [Fodinibius sp.]
AKVDESFNNSEIASYNITLTFNTCRWDTYEPNDTPEQANWIDSDKPQTHNIIPENDIDWVKFSVITESQVVLETSGQDGDTVLRLYDGDLNQLEVDDDDGVGLFSRIDRVCGSYGDSLPVGTYYASI